MTYEINVPDTPQTAVELDLQGQFDSGRRALERLQADRLEIEENSPKPVDSRYVLSLLRLTITLSEAHMITMNRDALRPEQRDYVTGIMEKRGRKHHRE